MRMGLFLGGKRVHMFSVNPGREPEPPESPGPTLEGLTLSG